MVPTNSSVSLSTIPPLVEVSKPHKVKVNANDLTIILSTPDEHPNEVTLVDDL